MARKYLEADIDLNKIDQHKAFGFPEPVSTTGNPERRKLLSFLEERRKSATPAVLPSPEGTFGEVQLAIPPLDFAILQVSRPELFEGDRESRLKAWQAFCRSELSRPYRTHAGVGKRRPNSKVIVR